MTYLIVTILLNTLLFALFKLFAKFNIDGLQAVVVNYFTCVVTGCIFLHEIPIKAGSISQPWFPWALLMGAMFISLFRLIAWRTKEDGMTITTIANKLSLVIPVLFATLLYSEKLGALKLAGILIAFPAIYFTTRKNSDDQKSINILFPAILFIGSGLLDTLVKYVEATHLESTRTQTEFTIHVFAVASLLGAMIIGLQAARRKLQLQLKNIIAGIILGVPNYFSIYYLIKLLHSGFLHSSAAIPVNNIGIVLCSAIVAIFFFKERASWKKILGLVLSIIAILMIALSDINGTTASI